MFTQLALEFNRNPELDDDEGFEEIPTAKCPFDASHIMQPKNLITHINRCKSPNKHLYVECRYDPCHWIYPQQLQQHYSQCPTRKQYYTDLELIDGDWNQQEMMIKIQQKMLKQKVNKRKRKLIKIMTILRLKKKLKKANTKQKYQELQKCLLNELSCFKNKSKNQNQKKQNKNENFSTTQNQSSREFPSQLVIQKSNSNSNLQPNLSQKTINGFKQPQINYCYYGQNQPNQFSYNYIHQYGQNYTQNFNHQNNYQELNIHMNHQKYMYYPNDFYWHSMSNKYPSQMLRKPQPQKGLKFSQTACTQEFIKKKSHQNFKQQQNYFFNPASNPNTSMIKKQGFNSQNQYFQTNWNGIDYPYYQNQVYDKKSYQTLKFIAPQKQKIDFHQRKSNKQLKDLSQKLVNQKNNNKKQNHIEKDFKNKEKYQKNLHNQKKEKQQQFSNQKNQKDKRPIDSSQIQFFDSSQIQFFDSSRIQLVDSHCKILYKNDYYQKDVKNKQYNRQIFERGQIMPNKLQNKNNNAPYKILDRSINGYNFVPFGLHQSLNTTIKDSSFYYDEQSQFLEMKQMLEILKDKNLR